MKRNTPETIFQAASALMMLFLLTCNSYAQAGENSEIDAGIQQTLSHYFSGRRNADLNLLRLAYAPAARLETVNAEGNIHTISFDDYLQVVKNAGPVEVKTSIIDISMTQLIAVAQTRFDYGQRVYHDYLTLLKTANGWKITNKAYIRQDPDNSVKQGN